MGFGFLNKTRNAFVRFSFDFACGFAEEIALNITQAEPANAMDVVMPRLEILDTTPNLIKKPVCVTAAVLTNSNVKDKIISVITGATFTGLI